MKIKVCGITNLSDALLCEQLGADALGFVFYAGSKRQIMPNEASEIIKHLNPFTVKVGVFVDENPVLINDIVRTVGLNVVQLHGGETPEDISLIDVPVIKSFRVENNFDFSVLKYYSDSFILLDSFDKEELGGTGKTFNWSVIPDNIKSKIILAGGINSDNVEEVFNKVKPIAIDVSSSLEEYPGKKDKEKVIQFFNKINLLRRNYADNDEFKFTA
ncbi:Phosphoribosylanthranilate isomerase [Ignavibacterium album JCM 16511]|uniref:N-(5'-phosphoribosyl)anthranilate isomerase n=1 Tax=Ignavibacterium album (strain DSM 19864 / JCM 16511 / NBRC 101810 / Mat9-16) TaxID=945713 RepID=I0AM88_IGNAJ|nr:phosphoribosylanthranilate isomerase [Ignavibacterium album]AFH50095.1 Phosphoribosylanthranilate isomerase [Ignavibacterium album JCM 16511]